MLPTGRRRLAGRRRISPSSWMIGERQWPQSAPGSTWLLDLGPSDSEARPLLDRLFGLAVAVGLLVSLLVVVPGIHGHAILPALDLVLDTIATVVCIVLTTLAWARFRERRVIAAAYHAAAFMALSVAYGIAVLVTLQEGGEPGRAREHPGACVRSRPVRRGDPLRRRRRLHANGRRTAGTPPGSWLHRPSSCSSPPSWAGRSSPPPDVLQIVAFPDATRVAAHHPAGRGHPLRHGRPVLRGAYVSRSLWRCRARGDRRVDRHRPRVSPPSRSCSGSLYPSAHPGQVSIADLLRLVCSACLLAGLASALRAEPAGAANGEHRAGHAARRRGRARSDGGAHAAGARAARRAGAGPVAGQAPDRRAGEQG